MFNEQVANSLSEMISDDQVAQKVEEAYAQNIITDNDIINYTQTLIDYIENIPSQEQKDKAVEIALQKLCEEHNGKIIKDSGGDSVCTFKDKEICHNSYTWPINDNSNKYYAEWSNDTYGGSCILASSTVRAACEENQLSYNIETGLCDINETYCKMKGADWLPNPVINMHDCVIPDGQKFLEVIFGTTVVRGIKQLFQEFGPCADNEEMISASGKALTFGTPRCYPKCNNDFKSDGVSMCYKQYTNFSDQPPANLHRDSYPLPGKSIGTCPDGYDNIASICYEKCTSNEERVGIMCREKCKSGTREYGGLCYEGDGDIASTLTYTRSATTPNKAPCDPGQNDDGTSCWEPYVCKQGGYNNYSWGLVNCNGDGPGNRCYKTWIPTLDCSGCGCIKKDLFARQFCNSGELIGGLCYAECRSGFYKSALNCTRKSYQPQSRSVKSSVLQCKSDEDNISGLCYSKNNRGCRSGYTMGNEHLGICSVNCPPGTQSTGPVTCTRESYSRGAGHPPPRKIPFSTKYN